MDKARAIELLPEPYARALTLKRRGLTEKEIAEQLGIAVESVEPCLKLAEAKLANLTDHTIDLTGEASKADPQLHESTFDGGRAGSDE